MKPKSSHSLEQAIETVNRFTKLNEKNEVPSLEGIELNNGLLEVKPLSTLEKTLQRFLSAISEEQRTKQKQHAKAIKVVLLRSVDILKVALLKLQNGAPCEQRLEERLLETITRYNNVVKKAPQSLPEKIKYELLKA